jgi:hypothetical protein
LFSISFLLPYSVFRPSSSPVQSSSPLRHPAMTDLEFEFVALEPSAECDEWLNIPGTPAVPVLPFGEASPTMSETSHSSSHTHAASSHSDSTGLQSGENSPNSVSVSNRSSGSNHTESTTRKRGRTSGDSDEEAQRKKMARMMKNRESAAASRERKRMQMEVLEAENAELRAQNALLAAKNAELEREVASLRASGGARGFLLVAVFSFVVILPVFLSHMHKASSGNSATSLSSADFYAAPSTGRGLLSLPASTSQLSTAAKGEVRVKMDEVKAIDAQAKTVYFWVPKIQPMLPSAAHMDLVRERLSEPGAQVALVMPEHVLDVDLQPLEGFVSGVSKGDAEGFGGVTVLRMAAGDVASGLRQMIKNSMGGSVGAVNMLGSTVVQKAVLLGE